MACSIWYRPVSPTRKRVSGISNDLMALRQQFGGDTVRLGSEQTSVLRAMHRASNIPMYQELIDAIEKYGLIDVYGEW